MEMPCYKVPTPKSIFIRVYGRAKSFVIRAGTVIFAITIIIWALSYYPRSNDIARDYARQETQLRTEFAAQRQQIEERIASLTTSGPEVSAPEIASAQALLRRQELALDADLSSLANRAAGANLRNSYFARMGRAVEPVFRPLGWDWRLTMAALASFPAREVIIATIGTIFNLGTDIDAEATSLIDKMRQATWEDGPRVGQPLFTPAVALSIMVFFALCCQCGATLVTIRQETNSWWYSVGTFSYMTGLAYVAATVTYQVFSRAGF
jgi:ferrous iron transport protein B